MSESQKRKADDTATEVSQLSFETAYEGDFPPEFLKRLDNPPSFSEEPENVVYLIELEIKDSYNGDSFETRAVFTSLSLANQHALNIIREEYLEFFEGDNWSYFQYKEAEPDEGMTLLNITDLGGVYLMGQPETQEDVYIEWTVCVLRHVVRNELPPTRRQQEILKRQKTDKASE